MIENIQSGDEYVKILIEHIIETEKEIPVDEQMPVGLLAYWMDIIKQEANKSWNEYIAGKRDTYMFDVEEMEDMFNKAGEMYTSDILDGMHEKGLLKVSIGEDGDFLYSLSEEGKRIADILFKK
jgi:hypothetical protein